jgi:hypothetical protein
MLSRGERKVLVPMLTPGELPDAASHCTMERSLRGMVTRKLPFTAGTGISSPLALKLTLTGRASMGLSGSLSTTKAGAGLAALK